MVIQWGQAYNLSQETNENPKQEEQQSPNKENDGQNTLKPDQNMDSSVPSINEKEILIPKKQVVPERND